MKRILRLSAAALVLLGCAIALLVQSPHPSFSQTMSLAQPANERIAQTPQSSDPNFEQHFQDLGIEGSILIYDLNNDQVNQHNPERNETAFLPASTFKIPNSLISLETGVIPNELAVLTWDGIERMVPEWNRDLNMKEAFRLSAVWFYQVLARRVGHTQMQQWVEQINYGNNNIGTAEDIDHFWLDGALRITPQQQIEFLRRLYQNELPASERSLSIVKTIMIAEQTPDYTLRAKTGWAGFGEPDQPQNGWYVGYLEQNDNVYFFATNTDIRTDADAPKRLEVTRRCFQTLGLL